jgi:hypothetical protein
LKCLICRWKSLPGLLFDLNASGAKQGYRSRSDVSSKAPEAALAAEAQNKGHRSRKRCFFEKLALSGRK